MNWASNFEQFARQISEWQRGILNNLASTTPDTQTFMTPNFQENFDNALKFQENLVTSSLELQASLARMSIETQKQFWDGYFNTIRNTQDKKITE